MPQVQKVDTSAVITFGNKLLGSALRWGVDSRGRGLYAGMFLCTFLRKVFRLWSCFCRAVPGSCENCCNCGTLFARNICRVPVPRYNAYLVADRGGLSNVGRLCTPVSNPGYGYSVPGLCSTLFHRYPSRLWTKNRASHSLKMNCKR